mmetsp:Transcript_117715/g.285625  ORF Transcript_117715/g.285625 Transcript_117715/m.285625 type:complete len:216 (+) Transcript_117715:257-904(+)
MNSARAGSARAAAFPQAFLRMRKLRAPVSERCGTVPKALRLHVDIEPIGGKLAAWAHSQSGTAKSWARRQRGQEMPILYIGHLAPITPRRLRQRYMAPCFYRSSGDPQSTLLPAALKQPLPRPPGCDRSRAGRAIERRPQAAPRAEVKACPSALPRAAARKPRSAPPPPAARRCRGPGGSPAGPGTSPACAGRPRPWRSSLRWTSEGRRCPPARP